MKDVANLHEPIAERGTRSLAHSVFVEGRSIPRLTMIDRADFVDLILDGRLCYEIPKELWQVVAAAMANALAIGAGYPSANAETKDRPFAARVAEIEMPGDADREPS